MKWHKPELNPDHPLVEAVFFLAMLAVMCLCGFLVCAGGN